MGTRRRPVPAPRGAGRRRDVAPPRHGLETDTRASTRPEPAGAAASGREASPPRDRVPARGGSRPGGPCVSGGPLEPYGTSGKRRASPWGRSETTRRRRSARPRRRDRCRPRGAPVERWSADGRGPGGHSVDSTSPTRVSARRRGPGGAAVRGSLPHLPEERAKPVALEEVLPSTGRPRDRLREAGQEVVDAPIPPLEEDLRDQVVGGGIAVGPHHPVRGPFLVGPVDVEAPQGDSERASQPPRVAVRKRDTVRTPIGQDDREPPGRTSTATQRHGVRNATGQIGCRRWGSPPTSRATRRRSLR